MRHLSTLAVSLVAAFMPMAAFAQGGFVSNYKPAPEIFNKHCTGAKRDKIFYLGKDKDGNIGFIHCADNIVVPRSPQNVCNSLQTEWRRLKPFPKSAVVHNVPHYLDQIQTALKDLKCPGTFGL